ncbi:hypothetical protein D9M68_829160 [compost metagenome]
MCREDGYRGQLASPGIQLAAPPDLAQGIVGDAIGEKRKVLVHGLQHRLSGTAGQLGNYRFPLGATAALFGLYLDERRGKKQQYQRRDNPFAVHRILSSNIWQALAVDLQTRPGLTNPAVGTDDFSLDFQHDCILCRWGGCMVCRYSTRG